MEIDVPALATPNPPCSLCRDTTLFEDGRYFCYSCELSWSEQTLNFIESTNAHRCMHIKTDGNDRCIRSVDHPNPISGHTYETDLRS